MSKKKKIKEAKQADDKPVVYRGYNGTRSAPPIEGYVAIHWGSPMELGDFFHAPACNTVSESMRSYLVDEIKSLLSMSPEDVFGVTYDGGYIHYRPIIKPVSRFADDKIPWRLLPGFVPIQNMDVLCRAANHPTDVLKNLGRESVGEIITSIICLDQKVSYRIEAERVKGYKNPTIWRKSLDAIRMPRSEYDKPPVVLPLPG